MHTQIQKEEANGLLFCFIGVKWFCGFWNFRIGVFDQS